MAERDPNHEPDLNLPPALRDDLRALYRPALFVSPELDAAVLTEARRHLTQTVRRESSLRRWRLPMAGAAGTAAAGIALAIYLGQPGYAPHDVNRSGVVDILDAFALARHIEARRPLRDAWDANGDGRVDQTDVDTLAQQVVQLEAPTGNAPFRGSRS